VLWEGTRNGLRTQGGVFSCRAVGIVPFRLRCCLGLSDCLGIFGNLRGQTVRVTVTPGLRDGPFMPSGTWQNVDADGMALQPRNQAAVFGVAFLLVEECARRIRGGHFLGPPEVPVRVAGESGRRVAVGFRAGNELKKLFESKPGDGLAEAADRHSAIEADAVGHPQDPVREAGVRGYQPGYEVQIQVLLPQEKDQGGWVLRRHRQG
jgi:hypothetical protein